MRLFKVELVLDFLFLIRIADQYMNVVFMAFPKTNSEARSTWTILFV